MNQSSVRIFFLYGLSIFCLSQSANFARWSEAPPEFLGFWRLFIAGSLMLPFAWPQENSEKSPKFPSRQAPWILLTALFFFVHLWTYAYAAQNTKIAHCMIIFATNPLFVSLGSFVFFKERFTKKLVLAYTLAFTGIFLLVKGTLEFNKDDLKGDLVALMSAGLFACYILCGKKCRHHFSNLTYSSLLFLTTAIFFAGTLIARGNSFTDYPTHSWLAVGGIILMPTLLGHALFSYLMKFMNINFMTCGKLIEPALTTLVAYFAFSEVPHPHAYFAFLFTAGAIVILFWPQKSEAALK